MLSHLRVLLGVLVCLSLTGSHTVSSGPADSEVLHRAYDPASIEFQTTPAGFRMALPGVGSVERPGSPAIPRERMILEAPHGKRVGSVEVTSGGWVRVPLPGKLAVASVLEEKTPVPQEAATHDGGGWSRGRRMESFSFNPVRWTAERGYLEVASEVQIRVVWEPDPEVHDIVVPRRTPWERHSTFSSLGARATSKTTFEPLLVSGNEPFDPRFNPSLDGSPVRYLIITSDAMEESFQRLADRKTALGVPAQVRTTSWISANYPAGVDKAQNIRNFLIEAVEKWGVEYVLLGGDIDDIPMRTSRNEYYGGENIPTDMYYTCLDGNWNENGNAVFGEGGHFGGDSTDMYPDVWVGRASTRDSLEAATFVTKNIAYETSVELAGAFPDTFVVLSEVLEPQNWQSGWPIYVDGAYIAEDAVARVDSNIVSAKYYENYTAYPGSVQLTKPTAVDLFDRGYNLVLHVGHGYRNTMAMGLNGEAITNGDVDLFRNGDRQGLLYAINCTSSALDFDCIAEHFMRNRFGGFVAGCGSTRWDFPFTGHNYQNEFFELLYQSGVTKLGETFALQKVPFIADAKYDGEHRWTQTSLIYLGDPDLDFHTGQLDSLEYSLGAPLEQGMNQITINVTHSGAPAESVTVCLHKAGDAYATGMTDPSGDVTLAFTPDEPGMLSIGLRKHNHWVRVDSLSVSPAGSEHLYVSGLLVDDTATGDGDGNLEAGETALLYPTVVNSGPSDASGAALTIQTVPSGITVLDSSSVLGVIASGDSLQSGDPLEVSAGVNVPDLSVFTLGVELTADGYSRQHDVLLYVGAPRVDVLISTLKDTVGTGNGNGIIEAGEDFYLGITLENTGVGVSQGLTATLSSSDPFVTLTDSTSSYGDLEGKTTSLGDGFQLAISDGDLSRSILLTVTDQTGIVLQRTLELSAPTPPTGLFAEGKTSSILLNWEVPPEADIMGYAVYRSLTQGGPYTRLNVAFRDNMATYDDANLTPLTRHYYRIAAVDSSGIESALSGESAATTSLPPHAGFPMQLGVSTSSSPCIGYYNGDVLPELVTGGDQIYVATYDGDELIDGDANVQTNGVFSNVGFGPFWAPPSTGDLDGDGLPEIVCATWGSGFLYVWDSHGVMKPGFPKALNIDQSSINVWSSAALADMDNDGDLEIFINAHNRTFAFHHDGTELIDGDSNPATDGVFIAHASAFNYSTPALADVDNDGFREVIVTTRGGMVHVTEADGTPLPNFPWAVGGEITNSPAVGDLDQDGLKEIVFATSQFQAFAVNINLVQPPGWPVGVNMNQDLDASPGLADMNGDGFLDVLLVGGNGTPYIYEGKNGAALPGWGGLVLYDANGTKIPLTSSPVAGNLDGDPELEMCFGGSDGNLYAFNIDLTPVNGFPIGTGNSIDRAALIWDVDGDGLNEVVTQSFDENLYVFDSPGVFDPQNQPWPMFHGNSRRTGAYGDEAWTYIGTDSPLVPSPLLKVNRPNPFRAHTEIRVEIPRAMGETRAALSIYDVQGRLVDVLHRGPLPSGETSFIWNGTSSSGQRLGAGVYFYRLESGKAVETRKMILLP